MTASSNGLSPLCVLRFSISLTTLLPLMTSPKTTCFLSRCGVGTVVMKNWEPLLDGHLSATAAKQIQHQRTYVPGPALAMLRRNGFSCSTSKFSSSNFSPYMLSPPVPLPWVKSPPWIMNDLMTRWKVEPL